jgi:hypothetical protein
MWELTYGSVPANLNICHRCDNKACVRLDHLFLGTQLDNVRDAVSKNRLCKGSSWHEAHKGKLSSGNNWYKAHNGTFQSGEQWRKSHIVSVRSGEKHPMAKLTLKEVVEIRKLYRLGKFNQSELGTMFGVSRVNVGYIIKNKLWAD